jgi:cytochrome c peroxidase
MKELVVAALLGACGLAACVGAAGDDPPQAPAVDASDGPITPVDSGKDVVLEAGSGYPFALPTGFPVPYVPTNNPLTTEKVVLGRHLFYDRRLSGNGTAACSSCHEQARAFTDAKAVAIGSTGQSHPRNSMTLANVAYASSMAWANPVLTTLEQQAPVPMFGIDPIVELGIKGKEEQVLAALRAEPKYAALFRDAFPAATDAFTLDNVVLALASFERTLISGRSRFDRFQYDGDKTALTAQEKRGLALFGSETLECFHCHGGFDFTDSVVFEGVPQGDTHFHNTGLYNIGGTGAFPPGNHGLIEFTGVPKDMGKFKAPTLRNIEKTAPYMHDGSIATLEEVVEHYAAGGRTIASGPYAGVGRTSPFKDGLIASFDIPPEDKEALVAFLRSLTDEGFLTNPALSDPWPKEAGP